MNTLQGNIFILAPQHQADAICITTNLVLRKNGRGIMGAGIAKAARDRWPAAHLELHLGNAIREDKLVADLATVQGMHILSFPTKHNWRENSSSNLIIQSCKDLVKLTTTNSWSSVFLPLPGCNNGKLNRLTVIPLITSFLDDRFTLVL